MLTFSFFLLLALKDYLKKFPDEIHRVPSSCCGKYEKFEKKDDEKDVAKCSVDELKNEQGCGDLLSDSIWKFDQEERDSNDSKENNLVLKVILFIMRNSNIISSTLKGLAALLTVGLICSINEKRSARKDTQNYEMSPTQRPSGKQLDPC